MHTLNLMGRQNVQYAYLDTERDISTIYRHNIMQQMRIVSGIRKMKSKHEKYLLENWSCTFFSQCQSI